MVNCSSFQKQRSQIKEALIELITLDTLLNTTNITELKQTVVVTVSRDQ